MTLPPDASSLPFNADAAIEKRRNRGAEGQAISREEARVGPTRRARAAFEQSGLRLLPTIAILALCSFAVLHGWNIVRFVDARAHLGIRESEISEVRSWDDVSGLRAASIEASLTRTAAVTDTDAARKRADDLTALLSLRPLSPVNWLSLSGMRLVVGRPEREVLASLEMSWLTGPNEGSVMLQRGVFGLLLWEVLPPDARKRVIDDMAGAILGTPADDSELTVAKNVLRTKSVENREEIARLMKAESVSPPQLTRLGL